MKSRQIRDDLVGTKLAIINNDNKIVTILSINLQKKQIHKVLKVL